MVNLSIALSKYLDNGQELTLTSDVNPNLCFVKASVEIRLRVIRAELDQTA